MYIIWYFSFLSHEIYIIQYFLILNDANNVYFCGGILWMYNCITGWFLVV